MLAHLHVPLSWKELLKRTAKELYADDVLSLAAQQAYFFFFALFPALLAVISIASFFPIDTLMDSVIAGVGRVAPPEVISILRDQIIKIADSNAGGLLTFAFLLTVWSSSSAVLSMVTTLNAAYGITEGRPWWKVRIVAIGLTLGLAVFILSSMALIVAGPSIAEHVASTVGLGSAFTTAWNILQWPLVFGLVATALGLVYYFAPDAEQDWVWITPGSVLATLLWVAISLGFKIYVARWGNYNEAYGAIGGVMVLMLWLYLSGIAILAGAELNAEIEHASPYGKDPGEKVPGEKKKIGPAAMRDYEKRKAKGEIPVQPFPDDVNCDVDREKPRDELSPRASDLIIGAAVLLPAALKIGKEIRNTFSDDRCNADAA
jgi:membrane protein